MIVIEIAFLFTKLSLPGDSEKTFRFSSHCLPHSVNTVPVKAERQAAGKLWIPIYLVFGLIRLGIEH